MADIKEVGLGSPLNQNPDYSPLLGAAAGLGAAVVQAGATRKIDEAAEDIAAVAESSRMRLEMDGSIARTPGKYGPRDDLRAMLTAEGGAQHVLDRRGEEVAALTRQRVGRYQRAIDQGATNAQAARIAMQKEIRDLISQYPGYAEHVRAAGAQAMGQEEFQVRSRDPDDVVKGTGSDYRSDFAKYVIDITDQANDLYSRGRFPNDAAREAWIDRRKQDYIARQSNDELLKGGELAETMTTRGALRTLNAYVQNDVIEFNDLMDGVLESAGDGGYLSPEQQQQLAGVIDQSAAKAKGFWLESNAGRILDSQSRQQYEDIMSQYGQARQLIESNSLMELAVMKKTTMAAGLEVTAMDLFPMHSVIRTAFGEANLGAAVAALYRPNTPLGSSIIRHNKMFRDYRTRNPGASEEQVAAAVTNDVVRELNQWGIGQLSTEGAIGALEVAQSISVDTPVAAREANPTHRQMFDPTRMREDATLKSLNAASIRATPELDSLQLNAVRQVYWPTLLRWTKQAKEQPFGAQETGLYPQSYTTVQEAVEARERGEEFSQKEPERWFHVVPGDSGLDVIRFTLRPQGGIQVTRMPQLSSAATHMFQEGDTDRGRVSVAGHPDVSRELFQNRPANVVMEEWLMDLNGADSNQSAPAWVVNHPLFKGGAQ